MVYTDLVAQLEPLVLRLPDKEGKRHFIKFNLPFCLLFNVQREHRNNIMCPDDCLLLTPSNQLHRLLFSDQKRIASWVRKLNEPNTTDRRWKITRNQHAELLRTMLERNSVGEPFLSSPPSGPVDPLPSSVTMFLESQPAPSDKRKLLHTPSSHKKAASLPDLSMTSDDEVLSGRGEPLRARPVGLYTESKPLKSPSSPFF